MNLFRNLAGRAIAPLLLVVAALASVVDVSTKALAEQLAHAKASAKQTVAITITAVATRLERLGALLAVGASWREAWLFSARAAIAGGSTSSGRVLDHCGVINVCEPANYGSAGIEFDSFTMRDAPHADILVQFGAVTGNSVLSVYCGATAGAKTTLVPFRYRLASGDFKAASADQYADQATDADGQLTLTAATYDHKVLVIMLDGAELTADKPYVTVDVDATATVLNMSGVAILSHTRFKPALTAL